MSFISKAIKPLAALAFLTASHSFAADILVENTLIDNNGVKDAIGGWQYEIDHMDVSWVDNGDIKVDVYTNFGDYNNRSSYGGNGKKIVFGDLLISTGGDANVFDYAFKLTDGRFGDYYGSGYSEHNGNLVEISSTTTAAQYHGGSVNHDGQVFGNTSKVENSGTWSLSTQNTGDNRDNYDKITFNFNVDGITGFQSASQLAFSWAMSCANDVIHDVVSVNRPSTIPEPATMMLFLLGLAFIARSKVKAN